MLNKQTEDFVRHVFSVRHGDGWYKEKEVVIKVISSLTEACYNPGDLWFYLPNTGHWLTKIQNLCMIAEQN